jgi:hypothetical protein
LSKQNIEGRPFDRLHQIFEKASGSRIGLDEGVSERRSGEATARHERIVSGETPQNHETPTYAKRSEFRGSSPDFYENVRCSGFANLSRILLFDDQTGE